MFVFYSFKAAWKQLKFTRLNFCFVSIESKIECFQVIYGYLLQLMEERKLGIEFFLFTSYTLRETSPYLEVPCINITQENFKKLLLHC